MASTTQMSDNQIRDWGREKKVITRRPATITTGTSLSKDVSVNHGGDTPVGTATTDEGVLTDSPGNLAKIIQDSNRQVPRTGTGEEVFGRMTESSGTWTLSFFFINKSTGVETPFSFAADTTIEYRYTIRTNFFDADEFDFAPIIPDETGDILATAASTTIEGTYTAAGGAAVTDFVYVSAANTVSPADATTAATGPCIGLAISDPGGGQLVIASYGEVTLFSGLTPGATYYLSETAGQMTTTPPVGAGKRVQKLGFAKDADTFMLQIDQDSVILS